jgi:Ca2+-binding RTX toxin-like protein
MTRQVSSEIDEILTPAVQQALLGQPQDLAAINIMRGRDLGIPALNNLRRNLSNGIATDLANLQQKLLANPGDAVLQEKIDKTISLQLGLTAYSSWNDFAKNLIHPDALVNFLAAYSFDGNLDKANMVVKLGHGVQIESLSTAETAAYADLGWTAANAKTNAVNFLGASSTANKGFENIDAWVGGLAEKHIAGGQLGATFDAIFADQMTRLINGDRFYYFWRLQLGLPQFTQLIDSVSTEQFKDVIERTTGAKHLTGDVFLLTDSHIELGETPTHHENTVDQVTPDAVGHQYGDKVADNQNVVNADGTTGIGVYSDFGYDTSTDGQVISVNLADYGLVDRSYIRDTRPDVGQNPDGTAASGFNSHETIAGTKFADFLDAGDGDDTEYGEDGNDILIGNAGADHLYGGRGNDYLSAGAGSDFLDGDDGDDVIHGGDDKDVLIGSDGNDSLYGESSADELHGNNGDDYLNGGLDADQLFGGYGNDILLGEEGLDAVYGEWGDDQLFGGGGPDQLLGGQGDDILHGGSGSNNRNLGVDQNLGEEGFNISSYNELLVKLDVIGDLNFQNVTPVGSTAPQVEPFGQVLANIQGLEGTGFDDQFIGDANDNWLIGGGGNDIISGGAGDDLIIGDRVRLDLLDGKYTGNTLGAGLLDLIPAGGGKHFTDLLKSSPNFVFGQDAGAVGANDIVTYKGALSDFTITRIKDASGNVINDENGQFLGLRVVDKRLTGAETSAVGDLLIGVDRLVFNYDFESIATTGSTAHAFVNPANLPLASTLGVHAGNLSLSSTNSTNSANLTVAITDPNVSSIPNYTYQWYSSTDQGATSTLIPGATLATSSAVSNSLSRVVVSYSDLFGANTLTSSWVQVGTSGDDNLSGSVAANDILIGLDGNDRLTGGAGNDTMDGGAGNDVLDSHGDNAGVDLLRGGAGDDIYGVYNTNTVILENAGEGNDTVWTAVNYTLAANVENMYLVGAITGNGNDGDNSIIGYGAGNQTINGGAGNDYLNGGIGVDSLIGGTGNDTLDGSGDSISIDTFAGGAGNDIYGVYNTNTVIVENATEGNDTVWTAVDYTLTANVENMYLVGALTGTGNAGNNLIVGYGADNHTINGMDGNDSLFGDMGADTIDGGNGADTLQGGAGADVFAFRFGQSSATVTDRVLDFTIGTDQIDLFTPAGVAAPAPSSFSRANNDSSANLSDLALGVYANADGAGHGLVARGAALVVSTGAVSGTYLVIDDGVAGFDANNDLVINIAGYTGALPSTGAITSISSFFRV